MTDSHAGTPDAFVRLRASGWIISLCLHGTAVFLAGLFVAKVGLAPPASSFHWDVTVVTPSPAPSTLSPTIEKPQSVRHPSRIRTPRTPIPPPQSATPALERSTESLSTSQSMIHEPQTSATALPPPPQDIAQTPQRPVMPPLPEALEASPAQPSTEPSSTSTSPSHKEIDQQHASISSPPSDHEPITQSSPSLTTVPQPPEPTSAPTSTAALAPSTSHISAPKKADYGWLAGILLPRIEALKQYPVDARLKQVEGRVVVRVVIQEDGKIVSAIVAKSSGHDTLDQAALETIRKVSPITLTQPLEQSPVTLHIPIRYQLGP